MEPNIFFNATRPDSRILQTIQKVSVVSFLLLMCVAMIARAAQPDIVLADFEGVDYGNWKSTGEAFGTGPATGKLPNQMNVTGFAGHGLASSYHGGDRSTGTLTSPDFVITRNFINFLIGGGGFAGKTCINLVIDGKIVRTEVGPNIDPGGSEELAPASWAVSTLAGQKAHIEIIDDATDGWGHISVDQIVLSDIRARSNTNEQTMTLEKRYLYFPTSSDAKNGTKHRISILVNDQIVREFEMQLTDRPDWFAHMDAANWKGQRATIRIDKLPADSKLTDLITQANEIWEAGNVYHEPLRGQLHFSARRGWNNDPNGMVYADGEYHLYFQHNPYGWPWGNMHWGHAVSRDMVHWEEEPIAVYPHQYGDWAFSGGAVVDKDNTSGWREGSNSLIVATYTSTGRGECIMYSNDRGRSFKEFEGNPIIKHVGRDPRPIWYEPGKCWVIAVYDESLNKQWICFYSSTDMKSWTFLSRIEGFFECPDLFQLGLGDKKFWVLSAASSDYMIGQFDGKTFTPITRKLKGQMGNGYYAAQTFSNEPKGRIVRMGWFQTNTAGMPFNQSMSLPAELSLRSTADGPRMTWTPIPELASLRNGPDAGSHLDQFRSELIELRAEFEPKDTGTVEFDLRGIPVIYNTKTDEMIVNGHHAKAPLVDGKQRMIAYVDRTGLEVFASDGLTYIPIPCFPAKDNQSINININVGTIVTSLQVYKLKSIWDSK